ncbi:hypothetical protein QN277_013805 [Acacia crassicarpa]|uniref:Uncharacterized protein n=1 Tax=Acacia crassicarpa TaxID=499986 RepID=A0AAE1TF22_9FABA|nr:hypothetical protein QN277_013805 [Acacia crassicarpa]
MQEKISEIESSGNVTSELAPNDSLGQVFGKEHPRRVRGVGYGIYPSQVFGSGYKWQNVSGCSSSSGGSSTDTCLQQEVDHLKLQLEQEVQKRKSIEVMLAKLYQNMSIPLPTELHAVINDQSAELNPREQPSSHSATHQP